MNTKIINESWQRQIQIHKRYTYTKQFVHLNKLEALSPKNALILPSLVEIGQVVLEKRIFKFCQCIFPILWLPPLGKGWGFSFQQTWMLCAKSDWNWSGGSGEEDENVKNLQQQWRQRKKDKLWSEKITWASGSGELKGITFFLFELNKHQCLNAPLLIRIEKTDSMFRQKKFE